MLCSLIRLGCFRLVFPAVALTAPHFPIAPQAKFQGPSRTGVYGDDVVELGADVGKGLPAVDRSGQATNPLLIFSSDDGPETVEIPAASFTISAWTWRRGIIFARNIRTW